MRNLSEIINNSKSYKASTPPWELKTPIIDTGLTRIINKEADKFKNKTITEEYIEHYLANSLSIYTDGSRDVNGDIGAGIVIPELKVRSHLKLDNNVSVFTAEIVAILKAFEIIEEKASDKCTIFTDSLSSIQALENRNKNTRPDLIEKILIIKY